MDRRRRDWWLVTAWLGSLALVRAALIVERDPYWQARAGLETLRGLPLVRPDTWSWDPVDAPFFQTSPLWNVVLGLGWETARFAGIFVVALVSLAGYLLVAVLLARRLGARPLPTLAGLLLCCSAALSMLSPRATLVAQTLFLLGLLAADAWRRRPRPSGLIDAGVVLVGSSVLVALGSWVHLSWLLLAPASVACWALLWATAPGTTRSRAVLLSVAGAVGGVLGVLAGPYGTDAWTYTLRTRGAASGLVIEWLGVLTPGLALRWLPAALVAVGISVWGARWALRRWRSTADPSAGLVGALCLLGLPAGLASVSAIRFVGISLLAVAPVAGLGATLLWDRVRARAAEDPPRGAFRSDRVRFWSDGSRWRRVLGIAVALLAPLTVLVSVPLGRPLPELTVVDRLPQDCRLVSDQSSAAVALLVRPDVRVWWDGRFDYWGHDRSVADTEVLRAARVDAPPFTEAGCVMLAAGDDLSGGALAAALDRSPDWRPAGPPGTVRVWVRG